MESHYLLTLFFSSFFGYFLKFLDLYVDNGLRWFRGSICIIMVLTCLSGFFMIKNLRFPISSIIWLAIFLSVIARGKIDSYIHGIVILPLLLLLLQNVLVLIDKQLLIFTSYFLLIGILHDISENTKIFDKFKLVKIIFKHHLWFFWMLSIPLLRIILEKDAPTELFLSLVGFLAGYTFVYSRLSRKMFRKLGIKVVF